MAEPTTHLWGGEADGSAEGDLHGEGLGWFAYFEMLSFMATLALGLVYVWRKGALEFNL